MGRRATSLPGLEPDLDRARELARDRERGPGPLPLRRRLRDARSAPSSSCAATAPPSCSSPPSRAGSGAGPSSASARARSCAGRRAALRVGGRSASIGRATPIASPTPRTRTRRSPTTWAATRSPSPTSCRRSRAARSVSSATTSCERSSRSPSPTPTRSACPDMALMITDVLVAFDHQRHEVTLIANAFVEDGGIEDAYARAVETIGEVRERLREPVPAGRAGGRSRPHGRLSSPTCPESSSRRPSRGSSSTSTPATPSRWSPPSASPRDAGGGLLDLPRPAHGQPVALHVLPRLRRLRDRGRVARAAGQGHRATGSRPGRSPAPIRAAPTRRRTAARPSACSRTRRSGPST